LISIARTALAFGCLILFVATSPTPFTWVLVPLAGFVLYSGLVLRRSLRTGGTPLLTLAVDTVGFVIWFVTISQAASGGPFWLALSVAGCIFLLSSAILTQDWPEALAVAVACIAAVFIVPSGLILQPAMICGAALAAVWMLNRRFLEQRLSRAARHSVVHRLEAQHARDDERQRIAGDFHDGPLQSFIGLQMRLEVLKKMLTRDPNATAEELRQLQELCRSQVAEMRAFARSMRPPDGEGSSLGVSISRMVEQFQKDTGIVASFLNGDDLEPAETETSLEVLQIVREALNNVQKHSRANRVSVAITKKGEWLEINVNDNGGGFPFSGSYTLDELDLLRLGPASIRRRVRALGGDMHVESKPGRGAALRVRVSMS
jgi:signal transduction histidine kinase